MRLLVVDDEPGICLALSFLLRDHFEVTTAETVTEGLTRLSEKFDIVLMDLHLPGICGYELLDCLHGAMPNTPIFILSGSDDLEVRDEVLRHGAVDLIEKPFSRQELLERIKKIPGMETAFEE